MKQPHRHAHGPLVTKGLKSRFSETKARIKRWAKRVLRFRDDVEYRDEVDRYHRDSQDSNA